METPLVEATRTPRSDATRREAPPSAAVAPRRLGRALARRVEVPRVGRVDAQIDAGMADMANAIVRLGT